MPPPAILDITRLDFSHAVADRGEIERRIPQRHEFGLLDAVVFCDEPSRVIAGYHDVRPDAWWVRGHIPGRPLFPGVLMIEVAAQLCSVFSRRLLPGLSFVGFGGVDAVKFRGTVQPPARFVVVARATDVRPRRFICETQGFVSGTMVFEGVITGMPV